MDASAIGPASLIRVDPDGTSSEAAAELQFPNGAVITDDGATLIIAETMGGRRAPSTGPPTARSRIGVVWAALAGVAPDGICLCADGSVWVANVLAAECVPVAEGGEVLERVDDVEELLCLHAG